MLFNNEVKIRCDARKTVTSYLPKFQIKTVGLSDRADRYTLRSIYNKSQLPIYNVLRISAIFFFRMRLSTRRMTNSIILFYFLMFISVIYVMMQQTTIKQYTRGLK